MCVRKSGVRILKEELEKKLYLKHRRLTIPSNITHLQLTGSDST